MKNVLIRSLPRNTRISSISTIVAQSVSSVRNAGRLTAVESRKSAPTSCERLDADSSKIIAESFRYFASRQV